MSREKDKPASLNEMLGSDEKEVSLDNLQEFLGDIMPEINYDKVGRLRLVHSLQKRYGSNFRQIPGVNKTLNDFDKKIEMHSVINRNKGVK